MLELMILGFAAAGPVHGYELRRRINRLHGHTKAISDGSLYPAIKRLVAAGFLLSREQPGLASMGRRELELTDAGHDRLLTLLRDADGVDITDQSRFIVVLSFLSMLPDPDERRAVLQRRLDFLTQPASFFDDGERPLTSATVEDPYRKGIFVIAKASSQAERAWLREILDN